MRRKDREMDKEFAFRIIDNSAFGLVSMVDEVGMPYGIPLSIVREENYLYFHSAMVGRKVEIFRREPYVSVAFIGKVQVPDIYIVEELEEIIKDKSSAGRILASNVFTTEFESAIVFGKVKLLEEDEDKIKGLRLICEKYTSTKMKYFPIAIKSGLKRTNVYKIDIQEIRAKRKKI